jgi:hypothetical protein
MGRQLNNTNQFTQMLVNLTPLRHLKLFDVECPICLEAGKDGNSDFVETSCGHKFHEECINTWTSNQSNTQRHTCPCCRQQLSNAQNLSNNSTPIIPSAPPQNQGKFSKSVDVV